MKIRKLTSENHNKASSLLRQTFPGSNYEIKLVENFHKNKTTVHEWVCIHSNVIIAYIAFSKAYKGSDICGLHLGPLAVKPDFQNQGIGSELLRFALRQEEIKTNTIFVLGNPFFYQKFGFKPCNLPICPFGKNNKHFLSLRNNITDQFTVGYESEFNIEKKRRVNKQLGKR
ncbi:MAG: N-acetyltransferase [Desulfobulbaceae bacterium]|nr:N-acetyltransferase [Desulfobulbaceae bacterium]